MARASSVRDNPVRVLRTLSQPREEPSEHVDKMPSRAWSEAQVHGPES